MIDSATQYSGVQKFYYLRTSLSGPALQLIQSIPISEENYTVAWKLLLNHYNHPKRLKHLHVEALFEDAALKKECAKNLAQRMKSTRERSNLSISGISSTTTTAKQSMRATLRSRVGRYSANLQFFILPKVTGDLPPTSIDVSRWDLPDNIFLADPHFDCTGRIDVLIGAEVFFDIMRPAGRIPLGKDQPVLVNSEFGWIVSGPAYITHRLLFKTFIN
uniref:DUF1758 domain-containing protein n=1 Tax=Anopheles epiroticus TaxID=199890 RepID=A0A182PWK4_9DIPT